MNTQATHLSPTPHVKLELTSTIFAIIPATT